MTTVGSDIEAGKVPVALAMDWGGTWARAAVIDRQGAILWQDRVANEPGALQEQLVHAAGGLLQTAKDWAGDRPVAGAGIALAEAATAIIRRCKSDGILAAESVTMTWLPCRPQAES